MKKVLFGGVALAAIAIGIYSWYSYQNFTPPQTYRIGILSGADVFAPIIDGFKRELSLRGYVEGTNLVFDEVRINADRAKGKEAIQRFVDEKVDLILVYPTEFALEAKALTEGRIPVVFVGDIEGVKLIDDIRTPGHNLTGVRIGAPDAAIQRLTLLTELLPDAKNIYLIYQSNYPLTAPLLPRVREKARELGLTLVELGVQTPQEITSALAERNELSDIGVDAIVLLPAPLVTLPPVWGPIAQFAEAHSLPISGLSIDSAHPQTLFVLTAEIDGLGELAASHVIKIFDGMPAGNLPVISPQLKLRFNYAQAEALGIRASTSFLGKVEELIR
jgi:putative tryptophan/tyrosine transport system substrate-binding protein